MEKEKIKFRDLSIPLKIAIISAYIVIGFYSLAFLVGVLIGMASVFGGI